MVQAIAIQVTTDLDELTTVLDWFEQIHHDKMSTRDWLGCKTALAEVFTNAVRHAHQDMPKETPINLEATLTENSLEVKVFDYGKGFDLSSKLAETNDVDTHALGGRGLSLINQIVDTFRYEALEGDRNCMLIVKNYNPIA